MLELGTDLNRVSVFSVGLLRCVVLCIHPMTCGRLDTFLSCVGQCDDSPLCGSGCDDSRTEAPLPTLLHNGLVHTHGVVSYHDWALTNWAAIPRFSEGFRPDFETQESSFREQLDSLWVLATHRRLLAIQHTSTPRTERHSTPVQ